MSTLKTTEDELVLEKFFKEYITVWYQEHTVDARTWDQARKELNLLKQFRAEKKQHRQKGVDRGLRPLSELRPMQKYPRSPEIPEGRKVSTKSDVELQRVIEENIKLINEMECLKIEMKRVSENLYRSEAQVKQLTLRLEEQFKDDQSRKGDGPSQLKAAVRQSTGEVVQEVPGRKKADVELQRVTEENKELKKKIEDLRLNEKDEDYKHGKGNGQREMVTVPELEHPFRPTKLEESFSEIFDNEWTDAWDKLTTGLHKGEEISVKLLHGIVMEAYSFSRQKFEDQTIQVGAVLLGMKEVTAPDVYKHGINNAKISKTKNNVNVLRKEFAYETAENVAKEFVSTTLGQYLSGYKLSKEDIPGTLYIYARRCAELCWLMVISDPPLTLIEGEIGEAFNTNVYRPYTKSAAGLKNPVVHFHVWPALLLHEAGPLIAKGVAQPGEGKK